MYVLYMYLNLNFQLHGVIALISRTLITEHCVCSLFQCGLTDTPADRIHAATGAGARSIRGIYYL